MAGAGTFNSDPAVTGNVAPGSVAAPTDPGADDTTEYYVGFSVTGTVPFRIDSADGKAVPADGQTYWLPFPKRRVDFPIAVYASESSAGFAHIDKVTS